MRSRGSNFREFPLNIVGSSVFGRYPKIDVEKTFNMFISDNFMVCYSGYTVGIPSGFFGSGKVGRAIFTSTKFNKLVVVIDSHVYLVDVIYSQLLEKITFQTISFLGSLTTTTGVVYIAENNLPQICLSDGQNLYIYDPTLTPAFQTVPKLDFQPGYLTFHDTYFIAASIGTNNWRLSLSNQGFLEVGTGNTAWPSVVYKGTNYVGTLQTKPDNVQAVVRFPSKGNMVFVMGSIVTEAWFDTGTQLFPYQRNNQFNIDYGCIQPATVAYMDEIVVWLAQNEKSGPVILYSDGSMPKKITTDGIDYLFSTLSAPQDSQAFLYRQDGHLFYHINFYTDNLSLYYDFNAVNEKGERGRFYHACDQSYNYFIAAEIAFFNNQYYFVSKNTGNLYVFDTFFTTYQDSNTDGTLTIHEIPRIRVCKNVRTPDQNYQIINDLGFTIESGEIAYQQQDLGEIILITQSGNILITQNTGEYLSTQNDEFLIFQNGTLAITQQNSVDNSAILIAQQDANTGFGNLSLPHVDLSISNDGGASFGNEWPYYLPPIGVRKNRLYWWVGTLSNDFVAQFKFWGLGRFVCTDGVVNTRI